MAIVAVVSLTKLPSRIRECGVAIPQGLSEFETRIPASGHVPIPSGLDATVID